jgi:arsenate reductase
MAEALLRQLGNGAFDVYSAGTEATRVHPLAIRAMHAVGIDMAGARSKHVSEFLGQDFEYVITVCDAANEACPVFPGAPQRIHWSFPDPSAVVGSEAARYRAFERTRNEITLRLRGWLLALDRPAELHGVS